MERAFWIYVASLLLPGLVVATLHVVVDLSAMSVAMARIVVVGTFFAIYILTVLVMRHAWESGQMAGIAKSAPRSKHP
jgi:hypothetical protein